MMPALALCYTNENEVSKTIIAFFIPSVEVVRIVVRHYSEAKRDAGPCIGVFRHSCDQAHPFR